MIKNTERQNPSLETIEALGWWSVSNQVWMSFFWPKKKRLEPTDLVGTTVMATPRPVGEDPIKVEILEIQSHEDRHGVLEGDTAARVKFFEYAHFPPD